MADETRIETPRTEGASPPSGAETKKWASQEAEHLKEELQSRGESLFNDQKASIVSLLGGIARALDKSAPNFEEEGQPNTARYTRQAAENLQTLSRDLRERDMESIRQQVIDLGRRQPALLVGGAAALGFVASRFFRSSAEHSREDYPGRSEEWGREEEHLIRTESEYRAEESKSAAPILAEEEARDEEDEFPI